MFVLKSLSITPLEFFRHLDQYPEDKIVFERARQVAIEIGLDQSINDIETAENRFELEKAKAKISVRSWMAEKLIPATYGQKVEHNVSGFIDIKAVLLEARQRITAEIVVPTLSKPVPQVEAEPVGEATPEISIEDLIG